jgi:ectoine hydroxylase-related dioxygenase (phytanoyl-CoA dioxygenase family)
MSIPSLPAHAPLDEQAAALNEAGCLVMTGLLDRDRRDAVRDELAPSMAAARVLSADQDDPDMFYPGRTRRASGLVACSETARSLVLDPTTTALCEKFLTPNSEFGYQLHVTAALEVGPGAREQVLHREDDSFTFFPEPRPNLILASMWAITDFRADNGGTLVVPGSHRWPADRKAAAEEIIPAEMPAGSVLYWLGSTLHGAGANTSDDWRYGVILTYSLGWLRQEENQYIDVPPEIARNLPAELRDMLGYKMYRALGFSMDPVVGERPD